MAVWLPGLEMMVVGPLECFPHTSNRLVGRHGKNGSIGNDKRAESVVREYENKSEVIDYE